MGIAGAVGSIPSGQLLNMLEGLNHLVSALDIGESLRDAYDSVFRGNKNASSLDPNEDIYIPTAPSGNSFSRGNGHRKIKRKDSIQETNIENKKYENFIEKYK